MSEKKVKITEKAFTDFTGVMFRTSFTKSVSDRAHAEPYHRSYASGSDGAHCRCYWCVGKS